MSPGRLGAMAAAMMSALAVAGCGLGFGGSATGGLTAAGSPSAAQATAGERAIVARARRTHEIPTPAPPDQALGGWRSPVQAVQVFAEWYINWTAGTVASHLRVLAQLAVGQARSAMTLAASQAADDGSLKLGGIANSGTVEAIAPVTDEDNVYAVVTRERTTATNTDASGHANAESPSYSASSTDPALSHIVTDH